MKKFSIYYSLVGYGLSRPTFSFCDFKGGRGKSLLLCLLYIRLFTCASKSFTFRGTSLLCPLPYRWSFLWEEIQSPGPLGPHYLDTTYCPFLCWYSSRPLSLKVRLFHVYVSRVKSLLDMKSHWRHSTTRHSTDFSTETLNRWKKVFYLLLFNSVRFVPGPTFSFCDFNPVGTIRITGFDTRIGDHFGLGSTLCRRDDQREWL